ncbi:hypothetical protein Pint_04198 [Pistacia integerrima]|uniref:Uncharacterized protein n=1 Tax=Pistacia integerrima TaxID=434235 RepID=A0ACC0ZA88_9ROSI|nr:hypothetical protein Pint_04198 [Pistacia integerrima]
MLKKLCPYEWFDSYMWFVNLIMYVYENSHYISFLILDYSTVRYLTLLARSFFMSFSLTILALLARLRVLVQQILLDVVLVFNMVSSLSQKKHSVKITQEGIEAYREFYPADKEYITLECVWSTDKFILLEKSHMGDVNSQEEDSGSKIPAGDPAVQYQSLEVFLGDDEPDSEKADKDHAAAERPTTNIDENKINLLASPSDDGKQVDGTPKVGDDSGTSETPGHEFTQEGDLLAASSSSPSSNPSKAKSSTKKVAFVSVSVKKPAPSTSNSLDLNVKEMEKKSDEPEDKFYNLLTVGNLKDSLF